MNTPEKDCIHRGWIAALALIAVLTAVSFIPPQSLGGVKLRRANILSDLVAFDDAVAAAEEPALFDEEDFLVDMEQVAERIEAERIETERIAKVEKELDERMKTRLKYLAAKSQLTSFSKKASINLGRAFL